MLTPKTTTPEDFNIFVSKAKELIKIYHLDEWSVYFDLAEIEDGGTSECEINAIERTAKITLNTEVPILDEETLEYAAQHEIIHLILAELTTLALSRFVSEPDIRMACERTVRKLQALL